MPNRDKFYDPQMGDSAPMQIRGFPVSIGGTYVLLDDVITALRAYAQSLEDPDAGAVVHEVASWLQAGDGVPLESLEAAQAAMAPPSAPEPPYGAEAGDTSPDIDRVEIFPDPPDDPRPKWYARSVDTGGYVMQTTGGSFDQEWVIQNAQERWPDKQIHLLKSAGEDSMWLENQTTGTLKPPGGNRGAFPSLGPPIRRLWEGAGR